MFCNAEYVEITDGFYVKMTKAKKKFFKTVFKTKTTCAILFSYSIIGGNFTLYSGTNVDKYSFRNDYSESAHPQIIEKILKLAYETNTPYGEDRHSKAAANKIRELCGTPDATVAFTAGGTATNVLAISAFLRNSYEAVICADTGHINVHETGSIEYSGRKAITIPVGVDGKLSPEIIEPVFRVFESEHMVVPKLVYISQSTELGTIYSKAEITALSEYCHKNGMGLFVDGARLASALMAPENDVTLKDLGELTDGFYLGGTKNGLLFGEALVLTNPVVADHLRWLIKQRGFMLAKGFVVGAMFEEALESGLYFEMAKYANNCAARIVEAIKQAGFELYCEFQTNQIFVLVPGELGQELSDTYGCFIQARLPDGNWAVRIVTSCATTEDAIADLSEWFIKKACAGIVKNYICK